MPTITLDRAQTGAPTIAAETGKSLMQNASIMACPASTPTAAAPAPAA